jgi:hypothetical protein
MTKSERCGLCHVRHSDPVPQNEWGSVEHRAQSATDEAVALAIANPQVFLDAWNDAVNVVQRANQLERDLDIAYARADRSTRALLRPVRDRQRRVLCASIAALWHLPHPSQITSARTGCLLY